MTQATRISVALGLVLLLAACSAADRKPAPPSARRGGALRLIRQNQPETLDPQKIVYLPDWEIASLLYEGLVAYGESPGEFLPLLAERWEQSDGGRRWVFHLRPGARFHDDPCFPGGQGRRLVARDVVYTIERLANPSTACINWHLLAGKVEGIDDFRAGRAPSIRGLAALDETRLEVRLPRPVAAFLPALAAQNTMIVPREAVEYYGAALAEHAVGTGPFRLVRRKAHQLCVLARNPAYWRKDAAGRPLPYLDCVEIAVRADATESVRLASLLKGDNDLFLAQQRLLDALRSDPSRAHRFRVLRPMPATSLRFLGFSLDTGTPLATRPEVRRAVSLAFDRAGLVRQSPEVYPIPAGTLAPPAFPTGARLRHPYDPSAARAMLAPYRKEFEAHPPVLAVNFDSEDIDLLRRNLAAISIPSSVRIRPARYYESIVAERPSVFRVSYTPSLFDPEGYYCLFYSKSTKEVNLTAYRNPEYDRTLEAAMAELNPARRNRLFARLEEMLHRDVPALYLNHGAYMHLLTTPRVRGVRMRLVVPDLGETWLEENENRRQPAT